MVALNFIKNDWVKHKDGSRIMKVDEYQVVESIIYADGNPALPIVKRSYNGKVWCTWVTENKTVVTEPFWESDLEPVAPSSVPV